MLVERNGVAVAIYQKCVLERCRGMPYSAWWDPGNLMGVTQE